MMFRLLLLLALIVLPTSLRPFAECEKDCTTTVVVQDCDGDPVANARVEFKICCTGGSDVEGSTDSHGQVAFPYCTKDICGSRIVLQGFAVSSVDSDSCKKDGKTSRCTIKMCRR
jgi:hypothetical protein